MSGKEKKEFFFPRGPLVDERASESRPAILSAAPECALFCDRFSRPELAGIRPSAPFFLPSNVSYRRFLAVAHRNRRMQGREGAPVGGTVNAPSMDCIDSRPAVKPPLLLAKNKARKEESERGKSLLPCSSRAFYILLEGSGSMLWSRLEWLRSGNGSSGGRTKARKAIPSSASSRSPRSKKARRAPARPSFNVSLISKNRSTPRASES